MTESFETMLAQLEAEGRDVAQICMYGHLINKFATYRSNDNQKFCIDCGSQTIINCQQCGFLIKGSKLILISDFAPVGYDDFRVPSFCRQCGTAYPWALAKIQAAKDLADEVSGLDEDERKILKQSIDDLVRDVPATPVAASKFKRLVLKSGKEAVSAFREILIDVASETAKKAIWGG